MENLNKIFLNVSFIPGHGIYAIYEINDIVFRQFPYKISSIIFFRQDGDTVKILFEKRLTSNNIEACFHNMVFNIPQRDVKTKIKITGLKSKADNIFFYKDIDDDSYSLYINAELVHLSKATIIKQMRREQQSPINLQAYNWKLYFRWTSDFGEFTQPICFDTDHYNMLIRLTKDRIYTQYKNSGGYHYLLDIDEEISMLNTLKSRLEGAIQDWEGMSAKELYEMLKIQGYVHVSKKGEPEYV